MINQTTETEQKPISLWQYVPVGEYKVPPATISHAIRGGLVGLWQKLRPAGKERENPLQVEEDLQALAMPMLDRIVSGPDNQAAAIALKAALSTWIDSQQKDRPAVLVLAPPHGGNTEILSSLAKELNWRRLDPPTAEQIFAKDASWLNQLQDEKATWVLPVLERCYLRHPRGLALVRQFFERLQSGILGRGIIGCDSWAWAYLKHVIHGMLPDAFVAQAFDHERLAHWFQELSINPDGQRVLFRQSDNGSYVLPPPTDVSMTDSADTSIEVNPFLKHLAAHSRGISGVAWTIWRTALRTLPDETFLREAAIEEERPARQTTIWVLPWEKLTQPSLPASMQPDYILVLHNLLLHNGLSSEMLSRILPLSSRSIVQTLFALKHSGLIEQDEDQWRVSAQGYPAVRRFLNARGYLIDDL